MNESLKSTGRAGGSGARSRLRDLLVVAEVSLATALPIGAGLLFRSFLALRGMDSGTLADRILTVALQLKGARYASAPSQAAYTADALDGLRGVPGVESAAIASEGVADTRIEGRPDAEISADWSVVSAGYFHTMGIPLLRGRNFSDSDTAEAPEVAIVNQSFARRFFPHQDPIGRRLASVFRKNGWMPIIGTVTDIRPHLPPIRSRPSTLSICNRTSPPPATCI
jgi:putative ABC transport system permease protein